MFPCYSKSFISLWGITIAQGSSGKLTTSEPLQFHVIWIYLQLKLFNFITDQKAQSNFFNSVSSVVTLSCVFKTNMIIYNAEVAMQNCVYLYHKRVGMQERICLSTRNLNAEKHSLFQNVVPMTFLPFLETHGLFKRCKHFGAHSSPRKWKCESDFL